MTTPAKSAAAKPSKSAPAKSAPAKSEAPKSEKDRVVIFDTTLRDGENVRARL